MQLLILLMLMSVMISDQLWHPGAMLGLIDPHWLVLSVIGPYVLLALGAVVICRRGYLALARRPESAPHAIRRTDRLLQMIRYLTVFVLCIQLFGLGWGRYVTELVRGFIFIDLAIILAMPVSVFVVTWWAYYPIDRRIRESMLVRQLDEGQPVWPIWTRSQYVWSQVRHQLLLMMAPMLLLMTWAQVLDRMLGEDHALAHYEPLFLLAGGAGVFLFAPLLIRMIWDTVPIAPGPLRQMLTDMCAAQRVRVQELLIWRTHGGLINAAVMGIVAPLRYILLSDGLVDQLDRRHVEAVMAHELGHVRRRHMPWMIICAIGSLAAIGSIAELAIQYFEGRIDLVLASDTPGGWENSPIGYAIVGGALVVTLITWALIFGYVSRRFERQADTFAVQHLAERYRDESTPTGHISPTAAHLMAGALHAVAMLNHIPVDRPSWRHGSIRWRTEYLESLIGQNVDNPPIDRQVARLCWLCAGAGCLALATVYLLQL